MQLVEVMRERMWVKEGDLLESEGQFEKAIAAYDHALRIDPSDADAWFNKGIALKKMGKISESTTCVETAINLYCGR